jgi:hypothetical protein
MPDRMFCRYVGNIYLEWKEMLKEKLCNLHSQYCCDYLIEMGGGGHYSTSRKATGSRPDEVKEFFSIFVILPDALGPGVHSAPNRNEYQKQKNNVSGE